MSEVKKYSEDSPLFVFCHGLWGDGNNVWFPFAFTTIAQHNCDFISPDCPNPSSPQYEEWKKVQLDRLNAKWNKTQPIILVGHSLGGYTFLRMLSECHDDDWAKHVKGVFLVSPVISPQYIENLKPFIPNLTEIDFKPILALPIKFRHIYNINDSYLDTRNSELLKKIMTEAHADYKIEPLDTKEYDLHFGGFTHYPLKEANEGLVSLLKEINPNL